MTKAPEILVFDKKGRAITLGYKEAAEGGT
jgi:hypothetical protein